MQNRNYPPAYLRYLKARLRNLSRPSFWGTGVFLVVFGIGMWQYLSNPNVLAGKSQSEVASPTGSDSTLSTEDRAMVADIDNFPVLIKDYEQAILAATLSLPPEKSPDQNSPSLFEDVISKQSSTTNEAKSNPVLPTVNDTSAPKNNNPFVVQTENLLQMKSGYGGSHLLNAKSVTAPLEETASVTTPLNQGMALVNQSEKNQNPATISPLQTAINQAPTQNLSGYNNTASSSTNLMGTASYSNFTSTNQNLSGATNPTSMMGTSSNNNVTPVTSNIYSQPLPANNNLNTGTVYSQPIATNLPQNSYTNFNNSQTLTNGIQTTSVTPSVTSTTTTNISPYSTPSQIPNVANNSTPSVYGNYGVQQSQISLPRPTPGPYGGVQINGYRYP
ncbi:hypothetical protein NIES37_42690 [Tolypothrix tenuis PCC 7101]|uniref:Uncharacterized protein n=1 Tax=Tolypothrix tenuis PCC 7101 TaxID=231146 RepID=A0A1Z4N3G1_9CYAN|nr:hypothetical protein [Aulosira sp. FACHB-113]BAZ00280.1 hypothetical protein NIES37_42690 [Tolypothrix tenuis PCC 7101]BAZ75799.1 hypothetical protein NIES50_43900 [Aulosira laxa NIES-50]